jgi:hypothetical protein
MPDSPFTPKKLVGDTLQLFGWTVGRQINRPIFEHPENTGDGHPLSINIGF